MITRYGVLKSWHDKETGDKQWSFLEIHPLSDEEMMQVIEKVECTYDPYEIETSYDYEIRIARAVEEAIRGE